MCKGIKLATKYHTLPVYNVYYSSDLCKEIENSNLCKKWAKNNYSYDEFKELVIEYKNKKVEQESNQAVDVIYEKTFLNYFIEFYVRYYYLLLIGIIIICFIVMHFNKKKNGFDI